MTKNYPGLVLEFLERSLFPGTPPRYVIVDNIYEQHKGIGFGPSMWDYVNPVMGVYDVGPDREFIEINVNGRRIGTKCIIYYGDYLEAPTRKEDPNKDYVIVEICGIIDKWCKVWK